jgi:AraC-like DNA-binding protein
MVRLDEVPAEERFDFWWQMVGQAVVSVDVSSDHARDFRAEMCYVDLGATRLSRVRCLGFEAYRSIRRIRRSDPEVYQLSLGIRGDSGLRQEGREALLAPTDLVVYDASRPFEAWTSPGHTVAGSGSTDGMADGMVLQVPHGALSFAAPVLRRLLARRMSGRDGIGALLRGLLLHLAAQAHSLRPADLERLSVVAVDLLVAMLAHEVETDPTSVVSDADTVLVLRMQDFIERHLDEQNLSPACVAGAHHVSLRQTQRLFGQKGHTVSGWIRHRRLERCRRALADPLMDGLSVGAVAARWGFPSETHFNRLFRKTYGVPPASYRRRLRIDR